MMRRLRSHQAGDTIIEVLISVAVISMVLAVSYGIASHSIRSIQDAQERNQVMQLAQRQVEFLRTADLAAFVTNNDVCFSAGGSPIDQAGKTSGKCAVNAAGVPTTGQPAYNIAVTPPAGGPADPYVVTVTWDSLLNDGTDNLTMYYRP